MSDEILWQDPPDYVKVIGSGLSAGRHAKWAAKLMEHPGKWAILPDAGVKTNASALGKAQSIRKGKVKGFEKGEWETAVDDLTIYVKYVGPKEGEPEPKNEAAKARAWAKHAGFEVPERGRLPQDILDRYRRRVAEIEGVMKDE